MKHAAFKMTPFQHCMNPIICIGWSDGIFKDEELDDLKSSAIKLASWFNISEEQAWKECHELFQHISNQLSSDSRFIYLKVPISCAEIHKNLQSEEGRDYVIWFMEDQATVDGKLTDDERQLISMYSTIIRQGGESVGIYV